MTTTTKSNAKAEPAVPTPFDLRDYFAAKAMHAELATAGMHDGAADALCDAAAAAGQTIEQRIAFNAYRLADAILAERAKGGAA